MESKKQLSPGEILQPEFSFFGVQAYLGETNHLGGLKATEELVELCHIDNGKYVLDVAAALGSLRAI
jgi:hypothetical protein